MAEFDINGLEWSAIKDDQKKIDLVISWFSQYYAEDAKVLEYPLTENGLNYIKAVVSGIQEEDITESEDTVNYEHDITEEEYYAQIAATEEEYVAEMEANMTAENMTFNNETINNANMEGKDMEKKNGIKRNVEEAINNAKNKLENSKLMDNIKIMVLNDPKTRKKFRTWAKSHGDNTLKMSRIINENPWQVFDFLMERGTELTAHYKRCEEVFGLDDEDIKVLDAIKGITAVIKDTMATKDGKINKVVGIAKDIAKYIVFLFVQVLCVFCKIIKIAWSCVKTVGFFIGHYTLKMVKGIFHLICKAVNWVKDKINGATYTIDDLDNDDYIDNEYVFEEE